MIIPERQYASLLDIPSDNVDFQRDLFATVKHLIRDFSLENNYRLICNGGTNQDVPILHFHLISDKN